MNENENPLLNFPKEINDFKNFNLAFTHDLRFTIHAIKSRISRLERHLPTMPQSEIMETIGEINHWLTEIELLSDTHNGLMSAPIAYNQTPENLHHILLKAVKFVKYRTDRDFFLEIKIKDTALFWINHCQFEFVFINILRYLIDQDTERSKKSLIKVTVEDSLPDSSIIRMSKIGGNTSVDQIDDSSYQRSRILQGLEVAGRIIFAYGGRLQIETPYQHILIQLPKNLLRPTKHLNNAVR